MVFKASGWSLPAFLLLASFDKSQLHFCLFGQQSACEDDDGIRYRGCIGYRANIAQAQDAAVEERDRCDPTNDTCPFQWQFSGFCDSERLTECRGGDCWDCDTYAPSVF
jgi:hypothetical protein